MITSFSIKSSELTCWDPWSLSWEIIAYLNAATPILRKNTNACQDHIVVTIEGLLLLNKAERWMWLWIVVRLNTYAASTQALTMLAEKTDKDVRACLNTLQFLSKQKLRIRVSDVARVSVGQKDSTKDIFTLWNDLLSSKVLQSSALMIQFQDIDIDHHPAFAHDCHQVFQYRI